MDFVAKATLDNACVNRDAATRTVVCLVESDIMGGTTIRRLIGHKDFTASVQRFVIQTADVCRPLILAVEPSQVEHVFCMNPTGN